jgi:Leucine-rich repeat (LRR) protein
VLAVLPTNGWLVYLNKLTKLETLHLNGTGVTAAGFVHLSDLPDLRWVSLFRCRVNDAGLVQLGNLTGLKMLKLNDNGITDEGIMHLAGLKNLTTLNLERTLVTNAGVAKLHKALPECRITATGFTAPETPRPEGTAKPENQDRGREQPVENRAFRKGRADTDAQVANLPDSTTNLTLWRDVTKAGFQEVRRMSNLQRLSIYSRDIGDEDLKLLAGHKNVRMLHLGSPSFTDGCFTHFKALPGLSELWFHRARITDVGLSHLKTLPGIRKLTIGHAPVTDAGMDVLKEFKNLKTIRLSDVPVSDVGLEKICQISGLQELALTQTNITDEGLKHLSKLTSLQDLMLLQAGLTNRGLEHVGKLTSLEHLAILKGNVTDEGLLYLKNLSKLRLLSLYNLPVSEKGVGELQKALPNCRIMGISPTARETAPLEGMAKPGTTGITRTPTTPMNGHREAPAARGQPQSQSDNRPNQVGEEVPKQTTLRSSETNSPERETSGSREQLRTLGIRLVLGEDGNRSRARYVAPVTDSKTLGLLSAVPGIRELDLVESGVTDEELEHLTDDAWITRIWLNDRQFTETAIPHLQGLPSLLALVLWDEGINDERLKLLSHLPKLESLMLSKTAITGEGQPFVGSTASTAFDPVQRAAKRLTCHRTWS